MFFTAVLTLKDTTMARAGELGLLTKKQQFSSVSGLFHKVLKNRNRIVN
jgi:hypothetical protein